MTSQNSAGLPLNFPEGVLTFRIGHDNYGLDVSRVKEIRSYEPPTIQISLSNETLSHLLGMLYVRGAPFPLIDLRIRDKLEPTYNNFTVIIVVSTKDGKHDAGFVVDSVSDVVDIPHEKILPPNELDRARGLIQGRVDVGERRIFLVDLNEEIKQFNSNPEIVPKE